MRVSIFAIGAAFSTILLAIVVIGTGEGAWRELAGWAVAEQRVFQNEMAQAVQAIRAGTPGAWLALMAAAGAYGLVHAVGPGHGKFVIGGVGLGAPVSAWRLGAVALASSLAQALWAIVLVYGGFSILAASTAHITTLSEAYLAPASYLAIAVVGGVLAVRGLFALWKRASAQSKGPAHGPHASCGCGGHGPSSHDLARLHSVREAAALVVSIAVRPCTGALFLLVIAWQMDIAVAGASAVMVMGLGTAATTVLVAVSSVATRWLVHRSSGSLGALAVAAPSLQLAAGLAIIWFAVALFRFGTV